MTDRSSRQQAGLSAASPRVSRKLPEVSPEKIAKRALSSSPKTDRKPGGTASQAAASPKKNLNVPGTSSPVSRQRSNDRSPEAKQQPTGKRDGSREPQRASAAADPVSKGAAAAAGKQQENVVFSLDASDLDAVGVSVTVTLEKRKSNSLAFPINPFPTFSRRRCRGIKSRPRMSP
jgi:hypothetical protein